MSRLVSLFLGIALLGGTAAVPATADDAAEFMARFSGDWLGTGELLVGPESGLQFHCELEGDPSRTQLTFGMTGRCWMGKLSAPVHARLRYNAETNRFYGEFMDGADGNGLDIVATRAEEGFSMQLTRGAAQGRLAAEAVNPDQLKVTVFLRDRARNRELPIIAMGFTRKDSGITTLPDYLPGDPTGSIARSQ
jgi:hypothetical protein